MEKDRVEIICKIYFLKMFLHFLHSLQSIFWGNTRMWDLLGQQEWSHELGGVKGKDPAVRMNRAGHILEKSFQENCILLDMPGWRSLKKRIAVDAESQIPSAQNCRSSLLAWGGHNPKAFRDLSGFQDSAHCPLIPSVPEAICFWCVINLSAQPQFICIHQDLKLWCLFPPLRGRREIRCEDFPAISFVFLLDKSFGCSCTTVIGSLGRRGGTAEGLCPSRNHIQALKQSDGHWNNHLFQRSHGIRCRQTLASGMEIEEA